MRTLADFLVCLALSAVLVALAVIAMAPALAGTALPAPVPPCATEDGSGGPMPCWWDASTRGNHQGHSVLVTFPAP